MTSWTPAAVLAVVLAVCVTVLAAVGVIGGEAALTGLLSLLVGVNVPTPGSARGRA